MHSDIGSDSSQIELVEIIRLFHGLRPLRPLTEIVGHRLGSAEGGLDLWVKSASLLRLGAAIKVDVTLSPLVGLIVMPFTRQ